MVTKIIVLQFNPQWILKNLTGGTSKVIDNALKIIENNFQSVNYWIISSEFHKCEILYIAEEIADEEEIVSLLENNLDNIDETTSIKITITDVYDDDIKELLANKKITLNEETAKLFKREFNIDVSENAADKKAKAETDDAQNVPSRNIDLGFMIGAEPLKKWVAEIQSFKGQYLEFAKKTGIVENTAFLFSIDRGNGLSKMIRKMAESLETIGYGDFGKGVYFKEFKLTYEEDQSRFDAYKRLGEFMFGESPVAPSKNPQNTKKMILAISLEEWIDKLYDKRLDMLFKDLLNFENIILIFTIPYVEDVVINRVYARLNDIFNIRIMKFTAPSMEEYFKYFRGKMWEQNITVHNDVYDSFVQKIIEEKNDGKFYGFKTVKKIATEVLYSILLKASMTNKEIQKEILKQDLEELYANHDLEEHSGLEQLNNMVALEDVKKQVAEIISATKMQKMLYQEGTKNVKPCFHMMFTGNPGTGKTVVARLIGKILKEEGVLSVGNFFEVSRQDLIGKYVGQTAPKTMDVCRSAFGSVLFIDEAYLLANNSENDYGSEAIGTLISEMENHRDNMVVIFAGYKDKMEKLFDVNSGLHDRIPYIINFPNYSRSELEDIFYKQFSPSIKYDEEFTNAVHTFFETLPDPFINNQNFSNGRFVRNLFEKIVSKASLRMDMAGEDISDFILTVTDFKSATEEQNLDVLSEKQHKRIGFY